MLSKLLSLGDRLELYRVLSEEQTKKLKEENSIQVRTFVSQIYDIINEEQLKIAMPIVEGRVIPLPLNARYDVCFYAAGGLYKCRLVVTDRYKEDGLYILVVDLLTELKKYQRRQYFRLEYSLELEYIRLTEEELTSIKEFDPEQYKNSQEVIKDIMDSRVFTRGIASDISGGGIRFNSNEKIEPGSQLVVKLNLLLGNETVILGVRSRVISSIRLENKKGLHEHRIEYFEISGQIREIIIRYIFEQERRIRKK